MEMRELASGVEGIRLLALDGGLDHTNTDEFIETMYRLLDEGSPCVVLDMGRLSYVASWGLASLVRVHHHYAMRGGRIAFANLHSAVATVLRLSHLDRLFDLYPTVAKALKALSKCPKRNVSRRAGTGPPGPNAGPGA
jgi:anti-sigma B factor antagonist